MSRQNYYLAGPMTGYPKFNFPLFDSVTKLLRDKGYGIVSPAEMDAGPVRDAALVSDDGALNVSGQVAGHTWGDLLARDVKVIADVCNGIVFLPGWEKSKGARLEAFVAISCKYPLFLYVEDDIKQVPVAEIMDGIAGGLMEMYG